MLPRDMLRRCVESGVLRRDARANQPEEEVDDFTGIAEGSWMWKDVED